MTERKMEKEKIEKIEKKYEKKNMFTATNMYIQFLLLKCLLCLFSNWLLAEIIINKEMLIISGQCFLLEWLNWCMYVFIHDNHVGRMSTDSKALAGVWFGQFVLRILVCLLVQMSKSAVASLLFSYYLCHLFF